MSAKFLYTVTDENPDLHKHIGCMNGIFQLFDRQHFLPGRRLNAQKHKRVTSGQSGNRGVETSSTLRKATENNLKEKQRISTESSRTSFSSSSCSSSFSSFDCHKIHQLEPSGQLIFPETPSPHFPKNQGNSSIKLSQSVDLHDVVKDCIYRGTNSSPIKTMKKDGAAQTLIHVDSPRPVQVPKSSKVKNPGPSETFQGAKLQEGRFNQVADCSRVVASKDSRRSSCDGREITLKSTAKVKELPRLSLDSKQSTMRSSIHDMKSNYILGDLQRKNENFNKIKRSHQEPECHIGPSSVVAKLMGLEISRNSISTKDDHRRLVMKSPSTSSKSSKIFEENKQNHMPWSPRTSQTEPVSPWFRNTDPVMKSPSTKLSAAAPMLRQQDDGQGSQIDLNCRESTAKGLNPPSVYGEIQKRWAELEFRKSGKDLRALKQILEAMQKTKELLETRKDQDSNFISQISNNRSIHDGSSKLANTKNLQSSIPVVVKETSSPTHFKSPIVIMKLATVEKASKPASLVFPTDSASSGLRRLKTNTPRDCKRASIQMTKDITPRVRDPSSGPLQTTNKNSCTRASRSRQISKVPRHIARENAANTDTKSETMSRLQLKIDLEKKSGATTPTSDLSTTRRQLSKLPTESDSPGRKTGPKSPNSRHNNQLYKVNKGAKDWRENGDANPLLPERHISFATHADREITRTKTSNVTGDTSFHKELQKENSPAAKLNDNIQTTESAIVKLEQPSPVSVLDATVYRDESPSPVKKISNSKDDWATIFEGVEECNLEDLNYSYSHISNSEIHPTKSENTECLAHTLGKDRPNIDYISPSTYDVDSDHGYIFEILLASGLLRSLDSGAKTNQLHKSGLPINPFMFFELEEIKGRTKLANDENSKIHRKLVFDAVNEILVRRLVLECSSNKWFPSNKKTGRELRSQQLWREICVEINQQQADSYCSLDDEDDRMQSLLWEELTQKSMNWRDCQREISGLVLDIERLIFRDLISEIVSSEVAGQQHQHNITRHCRKLFPM